MSSAPSSGCPRCGRRTHQAARGGVVRCRGCALVLATDLVPAPRAEKLPSLFTVLWDLLGAGHYREPGVPAPTRDAGPEGPSARRSDPLPPEPSAGPVASEETLEPPLVVPMRRAWWRDLSIEAWYWGGLAVVAALGLAVATVLGVFGGP